MAKRKDSKGQALRKGEHERFDGRYHYTWLDENGKRCYVYENTLDRLREKELSIIKDNSFNKEMKMIRKINSQSEVADFIDFFKGELPEVYRKLYKEFKKRKEIME